MKTIEMDIECQECKGTGVYVGMAERDGAGVVCYKCDGTGKFHYKYEYTPFTERKIRRGLKRVYKKSYSYVLAPEVINFEGIGEIDLTKEGVSYEEFLDGKMPKHIKKLGCPMLADQGACHSIEGFCDKCYDLGLGLGGYISDCENYKNKDDCWKRFDKGEIK